MGQGWDPARRVVPVSALIYRPCCWISAPQASLTSRIRSQKVRDRGLKGTKWLSEKSPFRARAVSAELTSVTFLGPMCCLCTALTFATIINSRLQSLSYLQKQFVSQRVPNGSCVGLGLDPVVFLQSDRLSPTRVRCALCE